MVFIKMINPKLMRNFFADFVYERVTDGFFPTYNKHKAQVISPGV